MTKTPKTTPASKPIAAKAPAKPATAKAPAQATKAVTKKAATPRRAANKTLAGIELELPRLPMHHYGSQRDAIALQEGDVIYVGNRHNLSRLRVMSVEKVDTQGHAHAVRITATAISLFLDGKEYVDDEQVVLVGSTHSRVAVQTYFS